MSIPTPFCRIIFIIREKVNILFGLFIFFANFAPLIIDETMKRVLFCLVILSSFAGCGRQIVSEELAEADSLIAMEKNDSAYQLLSGIKERYLVSDEDKAHYYLLMTRACILTSNTVPPDSYIDYAISYYKQKKDYRNLSDAYYYKGYQYLNQKDYPTAMLLFKKGEENANLGNATLQKYKRVFTGMT